MIVVGAAGSLGSALVAAKEGEIKRLCLFDKYPNLAKGIDRCDLEHTESVLRAVQQLPLADCEYWRLFFSAGVYFGDDRCFQSWSEIGKTIQINLLGITQFTAEFIRRIEAVPHLRARIVVTSSAAAEVGSHDLGYGVSKAGLKGLVRSISKRYASSGISIIGILPGIFQSEMSMKQSLQRQKEAIDSTHLKRIGSVDEVVRCASFALFEAPDLLTGTFLFPCGGQVA